MSVSAVIAILMLAGVSDNPTGISTDVPALAEAVVASNQTVPALPAAAPLAAMPQPATGVSDGPPPQSEPEPAQPPIEQQPDIVVTGRRRTPGDPLESINIKSFEVMQAVDTAVVGPVALGFERVVPSPIRFGLRNILYNLQEPVVFVNYVLQWNLGKAFETVGRFGINSTIGLVGLIDIAKRRPFRLPYRPNGFGNTLGYYGVKPGPYLFLPFVGATTVRDLVGTFVNQLLLPTAVGRPFNRAIYNVPRTLVLELDKRAGFEEDLRKMRESSNFYAARRDYYLQARQAEIAELHRQKRGRKPPLPDAVEGSPGGAADFSAHLGPPM